MNDDARALAPLRVDGIGFDLLARDGYARRGLLHTAHGPVNTPAFMPVGTAGTVKAMLPGSVAATGSEILLGNTYHLMLRPGAERVARMGGLHRFMRWPKPILTDSGGFQVMSLSKISKVTEEAVTFQSHLVMKPSDDTICSKTPSEKRSSSTIITRVAPELP